MILTNRILLGRGVPGSPGALAPEHPMAADGLPAYDRDVEKAKSLLDEIVSADLLARLPLGPAVSETATGRSYLSDVGEGLSPIRREVVFNAK